MSALLVGWLAFHAPPSPSSLPPAWRALLLQRRRRRGVRDHQPRLRPPSPHRQPAGAQGILQEDGHAGAEDLHAGRDGPDQRGQGVREGERSYPQPILVSLDPHHATPLVVISGGVKI